MKLRGLMLPTICVVQLALVLSCADSSKDNGYRAGGSESTELKSRRIDRSFFDERGDTAVTWLGMAGAAVNSRGTIIFIDPLLTVVRTDGEERCESGHRFKIQLPIEAKDVPRADTVMYTHADGDHFGELTAKTFAEKTNCRFIAPRPVQERLEKLGIESGRIITARDFESIAVGAVEVVVTPALHDWQKENPWQRGDCCGYIVRTADGAIWHPGDTRLIDEHLEVKDVDVLFFDVAA
ncbi:MAG: MBL fold metallo-hydrolase, partial [Planctomycetota bacterium]